MKRLISCALLLLFLLGCSATALASKDTFTFSFGLSDLTFTEENGFDKVKMEGTISMGEPGHPWLPVRMLQIAVPEWQEVERVEVISTKRLELAERYRIHPAQPLIEISKSAQKIDFTPADPSTYGLTTEYPGKLAEVANNGFLAGQHISGVALYPLQYIPSEGKLILYTEIKFRLIFRSTSRYPVPVMQRSEKAVQFYSDLAKKMVVNPEDVWYQAKGFLKGGDQVDFLIIAPDVTYNSVLQDLVDWKVQKGILTEILPYDTLISDYSGNDNEEKIRNAIKDYYSTKGTQWVLIAGDEELIPVRDAYIWTSTGSIPQYIPCQLYYSDLDGDWNADGDPKIGEYGDEVDLYPDVFVGRAPVSDTSEAHTFVKKTLIYETSPAADYLTRMLFAAAYIFWNGDGGDIKDLIDTTSVPDQFTVTKLYESLENLDSASFCDSLNRGQNIINHDGHGRYDAINIGYLTVPQQGWYNADMDSLQNDSLFGLFYSPSCKSAAVDSSDCLAEHWMNNPHGGGIAYCGNTRSGWSSGIDILEGPAPEFDTAFFSALFNEDVFNQGKTMAQSKAGFVPIASVPYGWGVYYRYTQYTLLLLGDPTLELWTDTPDTLTVSHASVCYMGAKHFVVDVTEDDAMVTCVRWIQDIFGNVTQTLLGTATSSGGSAKVLFDTDVSFGELIITVTKHNYAPYQDTVNISRPPRVPIVIYHSHTADDSVGTDNGVVNPGDSASVLVTVKNIGMGSAQIVSAILTTADTYVDLDTAIVSFGNISAGATAQGHTKWVFGVGASCPDSHSVMFQLDAEDVNDSSWTSYFELLVVDADFSLHIDTSDSDTKGVALGDSVDFAIALDDTVGGFIWKVDLHNSSLPPGVTASFYPGTVTPPGQSTFRIRTTQDSTSALGIHYVTITAASAAGGGSAVHEMEVTLFIQPVQPDSITTWYVSTAGHDSLGDGSEDLPFFSIQKGIDSADTGDTVMVEKGTYEENIDYKGKNILVTSRFLTDSSEATIESTIIDGRFKGSVVRFDSTEDNSARLYGFTILNGFKYFGAGIYISSGASPTIERNFIRLNTTETDSAQGRGGPAIYCGSDSKARLIRNLIYENAGAAAVFIYHADSVEVINNTISDNSHGGISLQGGSYAFIKNNIVTGNGSKIECDDTVFCEPQAIGYGIHAGNDCSWDIKFNDVWGHIDIWGDTTDWAGDLPDLTDSLGNISYDPLFDSVEIGDYHLSCHSLCIDSGDTADPVPPNGGTRIDMGAFEFEYTSTDTICGDLDYDGCITWRDYNYLLDYLYNNGPAPVPLCVADVNCDDVVDLGDLVRLRNYLQGTQSLCEECCD